ncbi:MAG: DUF3298 domain-containing protein [Firmicutes bacterium]|nr:DUF3298 domain-containing protein [Bacillota bacterium]
MPSRNLQALMLPRVQGLPRRRVQDHINRVIQRQLREALRQLNYGRRDVNVYPSFTNSVNENGVSSSYTDIYGYQQGAAHGLTLRRSFTFNLATGRLYQLSDLFQPGSNYIERINNIIKEQIEEQELPLIRTFESISPNQGYYLEYGNLVIYFQIYEYTPYSVGIPEFRIPYADLTDILAPNSPISRVKG